MRMTAEEAIDRLFQEIKPPKGNVITLREYKPQWDNDANWISGTGNMPIDALKRYGEAVNKLRDEHPRIDWTGVEKFDGKERHLVRYGMG